MRLAWIAACAIALGGCNFIYSEKPLFSATDGRGAPQLRPGVWMKPEKDCTFEEARPAREWPDCAGGMLVRAGRLQDPKKAEKTIDYLLVRGDPPVFQIPFNEDKQKPIFMYGGVRISARDVDGRVTGFVSWIAQCGPPPPKPAPNDPHPRYVTEHPLPGLKLDEKSGMCLAVRPGPVRRAVRASEAWNDDVRPATWVRDGEE